MASGNRGSSCCHPASKGWVSGLCVTIQSLLVVVLPCVDVACRSHWSAANLARLLCSGHGQCSANAARSLSSFPDVVEGPSPLALVWGPLIFHPHPPTHKQLSHCSQLCRNHGDCGGRWLSQAPSVSSLLQPPCVVSRHSKSGFSLISWRKWNKRTFFSQILEPTWSTSIHLEFHPRKGNNPLRDSSYIWLSSLLFLFLQSFLCRLGGNFSSFFLQAGNWLQVKYCIIFILWLTFIISICKSSRFCLQIAIMSFIFIQKNLILSQWLVCISALLQSGKPAMG